MYSEVEEYKSSESTQISNGPCRKRKRKRSATPEEEQNLLQIEKERLEVHHRYCCPILLDILKQNDSMYFTC